MKRVLFAAAILTIVATPAVFAGDSGSGSGRFATHNGSTEVTSLPDGGRVEVAHYHQTVFASQAGHPLDNTNADCVGMYVFSADGAPSSASGSCFGKDADGDGTSYWWRLDKAGTSDCPGLCGSWGYFDGTGKFKGISGNGTFKQSTIFPDGSTGTWKGSYSIP